MKRYGLIGRSLGHSFSARFFADKFARERISDCSYALYELPSVADLPDLLARTPNLMGFNVTIPYKEAVIPYLDALSTEALRIGAVNCVRREMNGRLTGYNTDADGFRVALEVLLDPADPNVWALVLGTGGASRAVQEVLRQRGIPYGLVSRSPAPERYTYDSLDAATVATYRLVINATPVGMYPFTESAPRFPYADLTPRHYLLDLIYNPTETRFLALGRERGARVLNGELMLRVQAEAAWRIWTGEEGKVTL